MLEAMNTSANPCDDFYDYACGMWNVRNVMPSNRASYSTFGKLRDEVSLKLKDLLETAAAEKQPATLIKARTMYKSCMNMSLINERDVSPLLLILHELGDWPVLHPSWNESGYDVNELVAKVNMRGKNVLWNQWVSADDRNSDSNIIQFDQGGLGMPSRDYFLDSRYSSQLNAYRKFTTEIAIALGGDKATSARDMNDMVDFEISLANITVPQALRRNYDELYNKFTVDDLYKKVTNAIDWRRLLKLQFDEVNVPIDGSREVVVYGPVVYFENLAALLGRTPKRTVANYILWKIVHSSVYHLSDSAFGDIKQRYRQVLSGSSTPPPRWVTCVGTTTDSLEMVIGRLFVEKYFDKAAKRTADEMIKDLRESFTSMLAEVTWMDENTRKLAIAKANAISERIGYPEYIMDDKYLASKYKEVLPQETTYFENIANIWNVEVKDNLKKVNERVDKTEWSTGPATVNAYYSSSKNVIVFPAGILQPPFYSKNFPKSLNYGGIGVVIGHEITHGFDDQGRQFDLNGNLKQWWPQEVIEKFTKRAQCIVDQYGSYVVPEINMKVNGKLTQGENIADNGGLKEAYIAYRKWVQRQGREEDVLPGLNLNNNQLFFLSFAQLWCGAKRPQKYMEQVKSDPHSPGRFRVVGTVSNSQEFADAYKCPVGSKMNPVKKCHVW
ncbi:hypothetical protein NP493_250g03007 [Ridgeia piscesae]|uniref:Uncharacterized protein n=1 Tax=Ridgeia piscesae TaxID=27915 RepID=A0AAD9NYK4_RIDPI|nr:hypothetical protein NP493_250g03007 [Ridgeia piscesae]